jgi:hypothetical protein
MAVVAFLFGSVIGAFCGLGGWLVLDLGPLAAFGVYLGLSMTIGLSLVLLGSREQGPPANEWLPDPAT